jgi:hypothetical protein
MLARLVGSARDTEKRVEHCHTDTRQVPVPGKTQHNGGMLMHRLSFFVWRCSGLHATTTNRRDGRGFFFYISKFGSGGSTGLKLQNFLLQHRRSLHHAAQQSSPELITP